MSIHLRGSISGRPEGLVAMRSAYLRVMDVRDALFRPFTRLLAALHITPNTLSYAGVFIMVAFVYVAPTGAGRALWLLVLAFLMDLNDGALARHLRRDDDRGKFTDMICDSLVFTLFVLGLVHAGILGPMTGLAVAYLMLLSKVLRSVRNALFLETDWHFKAVAGFVPNSVVGVFYALFVVHALSGRNPIAPAAVPLLILLGVDTLYFYFHITSSHARSGALHLTPARSEPPGPDRGKPGSG